MKKNKFVFYILIMLVCSSLINVHASTLDGEYIISSALASNKVIDLTGGKAENNTNIQLYENNKTAAQKWYFKYNEEGYYTILSGINNKYSLDITGGLLNNNSNIQLYLNNQTEAQKWIVEEDEEGYFKIGTIDGKYAIDVTGSQISNGTNIQLYQSNNAKSQKFSLNKEVKGEKTIADGVYTIETSDGSVIDIENSAVVNGANIKTSTNTNSYTQKWLVKYLKNGYYSIKSLQNSNYSIDVENAKKVKNTNIQLYQSNETEAQQWVIKDNGDGYYTIVSRNSGLNLDIINSNVIINTENNNVSQKFKFNKSKVCEKNIDSGEYTITSALASDKVIELTDGKVKNKTNIQLYRTNGTDSQKWYFKYNEEGYYTILSGKDNRYSLDIKDGVFNNNSNIQLYLDNQTEAQRWIVEEDKEGYFKIGTIDGKYAIDVAGAQTSNGTNIQLYQSNNTKTQRFSLNKEVKGEKAIADGVYIIETSDGSVIDIANSAVVNGANIETNANTNSYTQKWIVKYLNNGYYSIKSLENNDYSIDVESAKKVKNTNIQLYQSNETEAQQWVIKDNGDGYYTIISRNSGLNLDVVNSNIIINTENNNASQKFKFITTTIGEQSIEDGYYFINSKLNINKSLDIKSGVVNDNQNIQLYDSNSTGAQKWYFKYIGDGYYAILSNKDEKYAITSEKKSDSNIQINKYENLDTQKWIVKKTNDGYYTIINNEVNAFDIADSKIKNGTNIQLSGNNNQNNQKFLLLKTADGTSDKVIESGYYFINSALDKNFVLDIYGGSKLNGANVQLYTLNSTKAQKWYISYISNGYYVIKSGLDNSKAMDVAAAGTTSGTNVQTYTLNSSYAQQWIIKDAGDGNYYIISNANGLYLDVHGTTASDGLNVETNNYSGNLSQKFSFSKTRLENLVIDVSEHQGDIDWDEVKNNAGIYGVILRVGAGSANVDKKLKQNVDALKRLGIPYGLYIYSYAEDQISTVPDFGAHHEAQLEALRIIKSINDYDMNPTLGIYYDLEVWENQKNKDWNSDNYAVLINNFDQVMSSYGYNNWKIYANLSMANSVLAPWQDRISWIAQWGNKCTYEKSYNIWQYSSNGYLPGISTRVDLNYYYFD